jgi:hypothetical protein
MPFNKQESSTEEALAGPNTPPPRMLSDDEEILAAWKMQLSILSRTLVIKVVSSFVADMARSETEHNELLGKEILFGS